MSDNPDDTGRCEVGLMFKEFAGLNYTIQARSSDETDPELEEEPHTLTLRQCVLAWPHDGAHQAESPNGKQVEFEDAAGEKVCR